MRTWCADEHPSLCHSVLETEAHASQGHGEMHSISFGSVVFSRKTEWQQVCPRAVCLL